MKHGISAFAGRLLPVTLLVLLMVLPACKKKQEADRTRPERGTTESAPRSPVADNVVATVGDLQVTREEYEAERVRLTSVGGLNKVQKRNAERRALKELINRRLIELAAGAEGIEVTEEELDAHWAATVKALGGESGYQAFLTSNRYTEESHREALVTNLLRARLRDRFFHEVITEEQIRAYYKGYGDNPGRGHKVRVSRVLLRVDRHAHESEWLKAEEKLQAVAAEVDAGLPFEDAVEKYSEGPYAKRGGDMGWASDKRRPIETFGPALTMQVGEVKGPIRGKVGVELITVTDTKNDAAGAFEAERENVRQVLEQQRDVRNDRRLMEKLEALYRVEKFL